MTMVRSVLIGASFLIASVSSSADGTIYQCGTSFQDTPCAGAKVVPITPRSTDDQSGDRFAAEAAQQRAQTEERTPARGPNMNSPACLAYQKTERSMAAISQKLQRQLNQPPVSSKDAVVGPDYGSILSGMANAAQVELAACQGAQPTLPQNAGAVPRVHSNFVNPPRTVTVYPSVPGGAINPETGSVYPSVPGGAINPETGSVYPSVPGGVINP